MKSTRRVLALSLALISAFLAGAGSRVFGDCGPFADVTFFCSPILELYDLGIASGSSPTTFAPDRTATRGEVAAIVARSFNQTVKRTSRRAALGQWWTPQGPEALGLTVVGAHPSGVVFDGADLWVTAGDTVSRVRSSDGRLLETWTGALGASGVVVAMGKIFVTGGDLAAGRLFRIDPSQPPGDVEAVASVGVLPVAVAFDGSRFWTTNAGPEIPPGGSSVSIVTPGVTLPWSATTIETGFSGVSGVVYDGTNIWVTDGSAGSLLKLDSGGGILQTVALGTGSGGLHPAFDGANIWVPNISANSVSVVRASSGTLLATLTGNGLDGPSGSAFDGERVLVTNPTGNSVSLWRAADLAPLGSIRTEPGTHPFGVCSDGLNFWLTFTLSGQLARF